MTRKIIAIMALLLAPLVAQAQTYTSPTFQNIDMRGYLLTGNAAGSSTYQGDGKISVDLVGNRLNVLKELLTVPATPGFILNMQLAQEAPYSLASYGLYPQLPAAGVASYGYWDLTTGGNCPGSWAYDFPYAVGQRVISSGNIYTVTTTGVSNSTIGAPGPSGTGTFDDGTVVWQYVSSAPTPPSGCGTASLDAVVATGNYYGARPYTAQDVALQVTVNQYNHDSTWGIDIAHYDYSGEPPQSFAQREIEADPTGNGPDDIRANYDPLHGERQGFWVGAGTQGFSAWGPAEWATSTAYSSGGKIVANGNIYTATASGTSASTGTGPSGTGTGITDGTVTWNYTSAFTPYHTPGPTRVGSIILATPSGGVASLYKVVTCSSTPCVQGTVTPTWPTTGTVVDGNITWLMTETNEYQFGNAYTINGYGCNCYYGSGYAVNGPTPFSDAVIDISEATLVNWDGSTSPTTTTAAAIRLAANQPIDFSGNGTAAGQNVRTLQYSSYSGGLVYSYNHQPGQFLLTDAGGVYNSGVALLAYGTAGEIVAGTTSLPNVNGVYIGRNAGGTNEVDLVANNGVAEYGETGAVVNGSPYFFIDGTGGLHSVISSVSTGSTAPPASGIGVTFDMLGNTANFEAVNTGTADLPYPRVRSYLTNNSTATMAAGQAMGAFQGITVSNPSSRGTTYAVGAQTTSEGTGGYTNNDIGFNGNLTRLGANWSWGLNLQTNDATGLIPGGTAYTIETDLLVNGPDNASSVYDPNLSNRIFMLIAAKNNPTNTYATNTHFAAGALITATPIAGVPTVYIAQTTGTTGGTAPTWPATYGNTVTDGGVTWLAGNIVAGTVGTGIEFGASGTATYNTGIGSNATYNNAFLDLSAATISCSSCAAIRLASQQYIDVTANNTAAGKNQRIFGYTNANAGLSYILAVTGGSYNGTAFNLDNNGNTDIYGFAVMGAGPYANLTNYPTVPSSAGLIVGRNLSTFGENDLVTAEVGIAFVGQTAGTLDAHAYLTAAPAGTVIGESGSSNGNISYTGHQISKQGTAPTVAQTGGSGSTTLNAQATDTKGTITTGTSATAATVTWNTAYSTAPDCVISSPTGATATSYTAGTTTLVINFAALTSGKFSYTCIQ